MSTCYILLGLSVAALLYIQESFAQFDGNFTLQNVFGHLNAGKERTLIQCISSSGKPEKIAFSRPVDTGQGTSLPRLSQDFLHGQPVNAKVLMMPGSAMLDRVGAYACAISMSGIETKVTTLKLPPLEQAEIIAVKEYVVAHVGQEVRLRVSRQVHRKLPLEWRHNGIVLFEWADEDTLHIEEVDTFDAGIYECYYRDNRHKNIHAFIKLTVAGCPFGRFGQACKEECPSCYNGGICHDTFGVCICPPGFTGEHCEIACGENLFGAECDKSCSPAMEGHITRNGCSMHLFCKPDPYGCSCGSGFFGPSCKKGCEPGYYGADCLQKCRCATGDDACDSITGRCATGCLPGWTGESCQVPDSSEHFELTTRVSACPAGFFGPDCSSRCHCDGDEICDRETGACPALCKRDFAGPSCSVCSLGRFGQNCSQTCHCWKGHSNCRPNGSCAEGCAEGWTGPQCQEECLFGYFGRNCAFECRCINMSQCDVVSGRCSGPCQPGYSRESFCLTACPQGSYGHNCSETCQCQNGGHCGHVSGVCSCTDRFRGEHCAEKFPEVELGPSLDVEAGKSVNVSCIVDAIPVPKIELQSRNLGAVLKTLSRLPDGRYEALATFQARSEGLFTVVCSASNDHGADVKNVTVTVTGSPAIPDPPEVESVSTDTVVITWQPWKPKNPDEDADVEYQVQYRTNETGNWIPVGDWQMALERSIHGLSPDTEYDFAVKCRRVNDTSIDPRIVSYQSVKTTCGDSSPEGIPHNFNLEAVSSTSILLTWREPTLEELQCGLHGYKLRYHNSKQLNSMTYVNVSTPLERFELGNLRPNTLYFFKMFPITSRGVDKYFAQGEQRTREGTPGPVQDLIHEELFGAGSMTVSWRDPIERNGVVQDYLVVVRLLDQGLCGTGFDSREDRYMSNSRTFTVTSLKPNSEYEVAVAAGTLAGYGTNNTFRHITGEAAPSGVPANVTETVVEKNVLEFEWQPIPCLEGNGNVTGYEYIFAEDSEFQEMFQPTGIDGHRRRFDNLEPFVGYSFKVRGTTQAGPGPFSETLFVKTAEDIPGPVRNLTVNSIQQTSVTFSWLLPAVLNGLLTGYQITVEDTEGQFQEARTVNPSTSELRLANLHPETGYIVKVKASTNAGYGPESSLLVKTAYSDYPSVTKNPDEEKDDIRLNLRGITDSTATLLIRNGKGFRRPFTVIVSSNFELRGINGSYTQTEDSYIAAFFEPQNQTEIVYILGDGSSMGAYVNEVLQPGNTYCVWIRVPGVSPQLFGPLVITTNPLAAPLRVGSGFSYFSVHFIVIISAGMILTALISAIIAVTALKQNKKDRDRKISQVSFISSRPSVRPARGVDNMQMNFYQSTETEDPEDKYNYC